MHTPGRPGCGPADGEVRATPALMSAPTCFFWRACAGGRCSPCGPGLWACCPPFRSSGWGQSSAPSFPMHGLPRCQAEPVMGVPSLLVEALKQDGVVPWWWGPKADVENWTQPRSARRRPWDSWARFLAEGRGDLQKQRKRPFKYHKQKSERTFLVASQKWDLCG